MLNQCNFIGRLGRDPELRYTQSGAPVVNFSIACNEKRGGQEYVEWVNVSAWDKLAEICNEYLRKGSLVFISGRLQTRKWQDKDGYDRSTTEIVAREMKMLGDKRDGGNGQPQPPQERRPPQQQSFVPQDNAPRHQPPGYNDNDVPF